MSLSESVEPLTVSVGDESGGPDDEMLCHTDHRESEVVGGSAGVFCSREQVSNLFSHVASFKGFRSKLLP